MNAFMAGAKEMNKDIKFQVSFIGSWFDPPKAKETAFAMIDGGADLLYAERFGVSDAAKERKVLAIGNVIDTQKDYPETVVASALWHFGPTLQKAIAAIQGGAFKAENYGVFSTMKEGGCSLAPLGTFEGKVPEAATKNWWPKPLLSRTVLSLLRSMTASQKRREPNLGRGAGHCSAPRPHHQAFWPACRQQCHQP